MRWSRAIWALSVALLTMLPLSASDGSFPYVHKKKYAMGTLFEIVVYDSSPARASAAISKAFDEIVRLDEVLSNYKPESELSRLNRSEHFHPQTVSADLYRIIEQSVQYSRISGGKFDITVAPFVDLWKGALRNGVAPTAQQETEARACVGYDKINLLPPNQVLFRSPCLRIDVGAIGKGYALDVAATTLRSQGISQALLDAGGSSIYALGAPPGQRGWLVHLRDPSGKVDPEVTLSDDSLSTSEQSPPSLLQNNSAGHIINPETGLPLHSLFAVSAVAKTATASDALSTTLLLVGPAQGKHIVEKLAGSAAIWVAPTGETEAASTGPEIVIQKLQSRCGAQAGAPAGDCR